MRLFLIALLFLISLSKAFSADLSKRGPQNIKNKLRGGQIFELNSDPKKLLFTINADLKKPNKDSIIFISTYIDRDNNEAMTEEAHFQELNLQKYVIKQNQLNETYELDIANNKMTFYKSKDGDLVKKERVLPPNLVVGPSFVPFLERNWADIQDKKVIEADLAVLDYMSTFTFKFEKMGEEKYQNQDGVLVRMKPANILVASVVNPVYFTLNKDGTQILEIKGRMLPKIKVNGRWEDLEAEAVFTY